VRRQCLSPQVPLPPCPSVTRAFPVLAFTKKQLDLTPSFSRIREHRSILLLLLFSSSINSNLAPAVIASLSLLCHSGTTQSCAAPLSGPAPDRLQLRVHSSFRYSPGFPVLDLGATLQRKSSYLTQHRTFDELDSLLGPGYFSYTAHIRMISLVSCTHRRPR
jgi:hypothetical protein